MGWRGQEDEGEGLGREEVPERDRGHRKGSEIEMESRGLLNVDLWALNSPGLWPLPCRRDAKYHRFWLTGPAYIRN